MEMRVEVPTEEAQGAVGLGRGAGRDRRECKARCHADPCLCEPGAEG